MSQGLLIVKGEEPNWQYDLVGLTCELTVRFDNREPFPVYAVYATEIDCPEGETHLSWMLLTTELVEDVLMASTILRWYSYLHFHNLLWFFHLAF